MGGMCVGALLAGSILRKKHMLRPFLVYGILELIIGASGLLQDAGFKALAALDTWAFNALNGAVAAPYIGGIIVLVGIPTICMGATFPVLGVIAQQSRTSLSSLYGLNTIGAAVGALSAAFLAIPEFGVTHTAWLIASVNIAVGVIACFLQTKHSTPNAPLVTPTVASTSPSPDAILIVFVTGFATLALEIAWFRSLTAAFYSTTDVFALMLAAMLTAIGLAAKMAPRLKNTGIPLGTFVSWAGIFILISTPIIERFDILAGLLTYHVQSTHTAVLYDLDIALVMLKRFFAIFCTIGPAAFLLALAFPWINDAQDNARRWATLYAINTVAAVLGSIGTAWFFMPTIGFTATAWIVGTIVLGAGVLTTPQPWRMAWSILGICALTLAMSHDSGIGTRRAQGIYFFDDNHMPGKLLESYDEPDVTIAVVQYKDNARRLLIDGASASAQSGTNEIKYANHYMSWMGHLPMMLHPNPKNALVICFGTGQTANAVRNENPESLDIVDINARVFKLAHNFNENEAVLNDPRVRAINMDGRAYMRRSTKSYDAITLEPMPPNFSGVNALYSREFYQLTRMRLSEQGTIAQWVPFHGVTQFYAASIVRTFLETFPNTILWLDPISKNGILVGSKSDALPLTPSWPGFQRAPVWRDMTESEVYAAILLEKNGLRRYAETGAVISDDNQLLAYGNGVFSTSYSVNNATNDWNLIDTNINFINSVTKNIPHITP
jgi:spermidine synthase